MGICESLSWITRHQLVCGALPVGSEDLRLDAAATAYAGPLLLRLGRADTAARLAEWLLDAQMEEGYWAAPGSSEPCWLDTAIIAGSLLEMANMDVRRATALGDAVARAASWLEGSLRPGSMPPVVAAHYDPAAPPETNLLGLAQVSHVPVFREPLEAWISSPDIFSCTGIVQHFYCYIVEAIARVNRRYAWWIAARFVRIRGRDGSLVAYYAEVPMGRVLPSASWHSFRAMAHWAAIWTQLGYQEAAAHAIAYLDSQQTPDGGFTGGDGPYEPDQELTWAALYYTNACLGLATGTRA